MEKTKMKNRLGLQLTAVPLLFAVALLGAATGFASPGQKGAPAALVSLDRVVASALAAQPGRFVQAELHDRAGGYVYQVVVDAGSAGRSTLNFDARTGNRLG